MSPTSQSTSLSLIRRVREKDPLSWERLVGIYGPLVYRWCRRRGLEPNDSADVLQDVFLAVSTSLNRFEHDHGRQSFRGWLYQIANFKMVDMFRKKKGQPELVAGDVLEETIEAVEESSVSDIDDARSDMKIIVSNTLEMIRPEFTEVKWNAFIRTAVDKQSSSAVAEELGLEAPHVRQIKFRVLKRLRNELDGLEMDF